MKKELKFYTSKSQTFFLMLAGGIPILIGYFCLKSDHLLVDIIGFINLFLGLVSTTAGVFSIFDNRPQLILNDSGIEIKKVTKKPISWKSISTAEIDMKNKNNTLILNCKENLNHNDFKFIYRKTAKSQLNHNEVKCNTGKLKMDYNLLNRFIDLKLD